MVKILVTMLLFCFSFNNKAFGFAPTWKKWLLFSSGINNMTSVLLRHQQHGFCFVPMSSTWLSKLKQLVRQGDVLWLLERSCDFWRGCVTLHTPGLRQSSLNKRTVRLTKWLTRQSDDGLGSNKKAKLNKTTTLKQIRARSKSHSAFRRSRGWVHQSPIYLV